MQEFRDAVLAKDPEAMERTLADDVRFTSPVAFKPYEGRHITAAILRGVLRVMGGDDFRYEREITSPDGRDHALVFRTTLDGKEVNGCDFLHLNDEGKIDDFVVMVRPLSAAQALSAAMAAQFEQIAAEATAAAQAEAAQQGTATRS
ncbi:nuclear transport factor 2 family protein [Nocardiopsis tropica]|uniref:nuclear transport factor 2 family protein n=1 Tax=Tsukamurella strandjordii TaxID=147577 RepID=UPI0031CF677F